MSQQLDESAIDIDKSLTLDYTNRKPLFHRKTTYSSTSESSPLVEPDGNIKRLSSKSLYCVHPEQGETKRKEVTESNQQVIDSTFTTDSIYSTPQIPDTEDVIVRRTAGGQGPLILNDIQTTNAVENILIEKSQHRETSAESIIFNILNEPIYCIPVRAKQPKHTSHSGVKRTALQKRGFSLRDRVRSNGEQYFQAIPVNPMRVSHELSKSSGGFKRNNSILQTFHNSTGMDAFMTRSMSLHPSPLNSRIFLTQDFPIISTRSTGGNSFLHSLGSQDPGKHRTCLLNIGPVECGELLQAAKDSIHSVRGTEMVVSSDEHVSIRNNYQVSHGLITIKSGEDECDTLSRLGIVDSPECISTETNMDFRSLCTKQSPRACGAQIHNDKCVQTEKFYKPKRNSLPRSVNTSDRSIWSPLPDHIPNVVLYENRPYTILYGRRSCERVSHSIHSDNRSIMTNQRQPSIKASKRSPTIPIWVNHAQLSKTLYQVPRKHKRRWNWRPHSQMSMFTRD